MSRFHIYLGSHVSFRSPIRAVRPVQVHRHLWAMPSLSLGYRKWENFPLNREMGKFSLKQRNGENPQAWPEFAGLA